MSSERFLRQSGIINQEHATDIAVSMIGVGGIGSATVLTLAKMGVENLTIFDDDVLEEHNISNQTYPYTAVGSPKVHAMRELVMYMEGFPIEAKNQKYEGCNSEVVISGVDSMKSRAEIWEKLSENNKFYIDARMGGEQLVIYCIDLQNEEDVEFYKTTLHSDDEAEPIPCTERAIIYNTMGIASHISASLKRYIMGDKKVRQLIYHYKTCEQFRL